MYNVGSEKCGIKKRKAFKKGIESVRRRQSAALVKGLVWVNLNSNSLTSINTGRADVWWIWLLRGLSLWPGWNQLESFVCAAHCKTAVAPNPFSYHYKAMQWYCGFKMSIATDRHSKTTVLLPLHMSSSSLSAFVFSLLVWAKCKCGISTVLLLLVLQTIFIQLNC